MQTSAEVSDVASPLDLNDLALDHLVKRKRIEIGSQAYNSGKTTLSPSGVHIQRANMTAPADPVNNVIQVVGSNLEGTGADKLQLYGIPISVLNYRNRFSSKTYEICKFVLELVIKWSIDIGMLGNVNVGTIPPVFEIQARLSMCIPVEGAALANMAKVKIARTMLKFIAVDCVSVGTDSASQLCLVKPGSNYSPLAQFNGARCANSQRHCLTLILLHHIAPWFKNVIPASSRLSRAMSSHEEYKLLPDSPIDNDEPSLLPPSKSPWKKTVLYWIFAVHSIITLALLTALYRAFRYPSSQICAQMLYSPAQDAIAYETRQFYLPLNVSGSVYLSDPSPEVDQAWDTLYNELGLSQISENEASRLPDETAPFPDDPTKRVVILSVFHQLHCLNVLRKIYHSDYYADPITGDVGDTPHKDISVHVAHCLDVLRQEIMCAADVSPIVFQWNEERQETLPMMSIAHTCRKWENIVDWANAHKL
ncbi:hypothetical protein NM688_g2069 [Phlebia brevispora]|uniref:Uncharacterized protein n=1 Tax=Phlebia brevispora TaxID=194682 RepID=A0ACC1T9F4_9APHY|nr:hypothetical protein NM688_g2069 [Phlebia brevispora]